MLVDLFTLSFTTGVCFRPSLAFPFLNSAEEKGGDPGMRDGGFNRLAPRVTRFQLGIAVGPLGIFFPRDKKAGGAPWEFYSFTT